MGAVHARTPLDAEPPLDHHGCRCGLLCGLHHAGAPDCPPASSRRMTTRRPQVYHGVASRLHAWRRPAMRPSMPASCIGKVDHIQSVYTTIGGGRAGSDPFAPAGLPPRCARPRSRCCLTERGQRPRKQGHRKRTSARRMAELPGVRSKVGLGGSWREVPAGADRRRPCWPWPGGRCCGERPAHDSRPGQHHFQRQSDPLPKLPVRPDFAKAADLGVTSAAIGETLRIATVGDYDRLRLPSST